MCSECDEIGEARSIRSPYQLSQLIGQIRDAIAAGVLEANEFESTRASIGQEPFDRISAEGPWPDVMCCFFKCRACGQPFELSVETYHGRGGTWQPVGRPIRH
jgi:hypothetical protein